MAGVGDATALAGGGDAIALVAWVVKGLEPKALGPDEWDEADRGSPM